MAIHMQLKISDRRESGGPEAAASEPIVGCGWGLVQARLKYRGP